MSPTLIHLTYAAAYHNERRYRQSARGACAGAAPK
jgi:hypothetical protein